MRSERKAADTADLQTQLGNELADVLRYIVAIAAVNNIDLNNMITSKDRLASIKYNHEVSLESFLSNQEK